MNVKEKRRANLQALIKKFDTIEALAGVTGINPKYLSQINNGVRNMGDKTAEKIEQSLNLEAGDMDNSPKPEQVLPGPLQKQGEDANKLRKQLAREVTSLSVAELKAALQSVQSIKSLR